MFMLLMVTKRCRQLVVFVCFLFILTVSCSQETDNTAAKENAQHLGSRSTAMPGGRLTGVNWFGFETGNYVAHGLWSRDYRSVLQQISDLGFNCVRIPWCNEMLDKTPSSIQINAYGVDAYTNETGLNLDLEGLSSIEVLDKIIDYAGTLGLKIILDNHSRSADGYMSETLWYTDTCSEAQWIDDWKFMVTRYLANTNVVGADLNNEPHGNTGTGQKPPAYWGSDLPGYPDTDWKAAAVRCGQELLQINPDILIIVEGVEEYPQGETYWWGGNLKGVKDYPITELPAGNVVYSPHEYGPEVHPQTWFSEADFPNNMPAIWDEHFWFIYKENIAPLLFGEFGIKEASAADPSSTSYIWFTTFMEYVGSKASWTFWCMNPNSGDTGGILQDDWVSVNTAKYNLIAPYLEQGGTPVGPAITPTTATFDLNPAMQDDVEVTLVPNGTTLNAISVGGTDLQSGTDYQMTGNQVVILKEYLATQQTGTLSLTFDFSGSGSDPVLSITIVNTQPDGPSISPNSVTFNKTNPSDISVAMDLNGYALTAINLGSSTLTEGSDYTVSGDSLTLLEDYLMGLSAGTYELTLSFEDGSDNKQLVLTVEVKDVTSVGLLVEMFNRNTVSSVSMIDPLIQLTNNSDSIIDLSILTIRYYYTIDSSGSTGQSYWCDYAVKIDGERTVLTTVITGQFVNVDPAYSGADTYLEIGFDSTAGELNPGGTVEIQSRFAKSDWSQYDQSDDYSFNSDATGYTEWDKITAYVSGALAWGIEPL